MVVEKICVFFKVVQFGDICNYYALRRRSLQGIIGGEKQVNTCRSPLTSVVKLIPENLRGEWIIKDLQFQLHAITITITWGKLLFLGKTTGGPIRKIRLNMNATIEGEYNIRKWAPIQG